MKTPQLLFILALAALVTACASSSPKPENASATTAPATPGAAGEFYHPVILNPDTTKVVTPKCIYAGSKEEADGFCSKYTADGYRLVGYSSFSQPSMTINPTGEDNMIAQAKKIGASIIIYYTTAAEPQTVQYAIEGAVVSNSVPVADYYIQFLATP